ncbi:MAG: lipocalin-like domain-containing protein [Pseudomonadota bacterium]
MSARVIIAALFLLAQVQSAFAQGFGGLGTTAEGFSRPVRGKPFSFPADHGPHPEYRIEWWYLTANLKGADGKNYGVQWTLFRSALRPGDGVKEGWNSPQVWMGHAAITTPDKHFVAETRARGGMGLAGAAGNPFLAFVNDWSMTSTATVDQDAYSAVTLKATGANFRYDLALKAQGPLVPHGDNGFSVKSAEGQASYYYSQPFYTVTGKLNLPDGPIEVTGNAWLDREWSSQPLADNQKGWDWVSLKLGGGARLMGFRLRQTDGTFYTSATHIAADGTPTPYGDGALTMEPIETHEVAGRTVPVGWRVQLPAEGVDVTLQALNPNAWMATSIPYWEGPVRITANTNDQPLGFGYLEMTGY